MNKKILFSLALALVGFTMEGKTKQENTTPKTHLSFFDNLDNKFHQLFDSEEKTDTQDAKNLKKIEGGFRALEIKIAAKGDESILNKILENMKANAKKLVEKDAKKTAGKFIAKGVQIIQRHLKELEAEDSNINQSEFDNELNADEAEGEALENEAASE